MTSVDSGVETGNDSNDSSVTHENNMMAAAGGGGVSAVVQVQASGSNITVNVNSDHVGSHKQLPFPIATITRYQERESSSDKRRFEQSGSSKFEIKFPLSPIRKLQNATTGVQPVTNNIDTSTSLPSTSGPLVLHANAEPTKVLEFRIPPMYIEPIYGSSGQLPNRPVELFKRVCFQDSHGLESVKNRRKMMRMHTVRRDSKFKTWQDFKGAYDERKMRLAAATNNVEMMRRLLTSGVRPNNHDDQGRSPLHLASSRGYTDVVRLLLEHGADPNQRDCLGNTPLHLATVTSKIAVVTLLLKAGTDVLSSDLHGHNPLQLAQTKLRILQNCKGSDMNRFKEEVHNIVSMLLAYLQRQKDAREQVEALSTFCSRLSLSNTSDQIQGDVRDLLANIDSLSLAS